MKKSIFILLLICAAVFSGEADCTDNNIISNIENIMQWEEKFGFSGSVLIVKNDEIILSKGYGYANGEMVFMNTPRTAFYIASVSKPVTALAVMKLVEGKKIDLSDPLTKYFPGVPEDKKAITVEMLLTHTSGLEHTYSCDNIYDRSEAVSTILKSTPLISVPGEEYNYSGDNYTLLAALIEIVSGYKYENYLSEKILIPAGIETPAFTGNLQLLKDDDIALPSGSSDYKSLRDIKPSWGRKGRAGLVLSVEDLYKLDFAFAENKLFSPEITENILSPKIKNTAGENYGYGFNVDKTARGTRVFGHSGDDDAIGHNAVYLNFPDENVKIFITSNSAMYSGTSWSAVISSLLQRFLFSSDFSYPADQLYYNEFRKNTLDELEKLEGVYEDENTSYHVWLNNSGQLIISPAGADEIKAFGFSDTYTEKNKLTRELLNQTIDMQFELLRKNCKDEASFEKIKKSFTGFWSSLEKKYGSPERIEIMGTGNIWSANHGAETATWFRTVFAEGSRVYRLEWDGNNKAAGLGGSRIAYPVMFSMNSISEREMIGFDAANGRTIAVNFLRQMSGDKKAMELNINGEKSVKLYRTNDVALLPKRSAALILYNSISEKGITPAMEDLLQKLENNPDRFDVDEGELNDVGYKFLNDNRTDEAIAVFTFITHKFSGSSNAFDSLGEAYLKSGNKKEAVKNYEKSLLLDPENANARKMLEELNK